MGTKGDAELFGELLARQKSGHALDRAFYCDGAIFRRDVDKVLSRHWLLAGHASRIPNPGDYFLFDLAAEQAIVVRAQDGAIRAHANVCRHRGSRVCTEPRGNAKVFICPYHAWAYNLDGTLRAARHAPEDFDRAAYGLKPIHVRVIEGLIFVSFADVPLGLARAETALRECLGPYEWSKARVAHSELYPIAGNWKLAVENYLECYHCAPAHPEYSRLHALEQPWAKIEALNAAMNARAASFGVHIPVHEHWAPSAEGEEAVFAFRYALYDGVLTAGPDGKAVAPLMGRMNDYDGGVTTIHFGPASFFIAYPDHGVLYRFIAKTVDTSALEVVWLVRGDAREGVDYDLEKLTWVWKVTSEADKRIIEWNQAGVNSRHYEPGPYMPMERNARRYAAWYLGEVT